MTPEQEQRIKAMMRETAKEEVTVQQVCDCLYTYGSELACLRIFAKYNTNGAYPNRNARVGFSENLKTWYFCLENLSFPSHGANQPTDDSPSACNETCAGHAQFCDGYCDHYQDHTNACQQQIM